MNKNPLEYAKSEEEAIKRFGVYKSYDPFPKIESALLNSFDVKQYIKATALVFPFYEKDIKNSAAYRMRLAGEVVFWDKKGDKQHIKELKPKEEIVFHKNSITYVTVNGEFRLPEYIACRFNLQINHVHRGLLLGTGPLINPGFSGKLMIPIHNFTENDYKIKEDDPLISVEFTKLSINKAWLNKGKDKEQLNYKENRGDKNNKDFEAFLKKALPLGISDVRSSLSKTLSDAQNQINVSEEFVKTSESKFKKQIKEIKDSADSAKSQYEDLIRKTNRKMLLGTIIAVITLAISIYILHINMESVITQSISITQDANKYVHDASLVFKDDTNGQYLYLKSNDSLLVIKKSIKHQDSLYHNLKKDYKEMQYRFKNKAYSDSIKIRELTNITIDLQKQIKSIKDSLSVK